MDTDSLINAVLEEWFGPAGQQPTFLLPLSSNPETETIQIIPTASQPQKKKPQAEKTVLDWTNFLETNETNILFKSNMVLGEESAAGSVLVRLDMVTEQQALLLAASLIRVEHIPDVNMISLLEKNIGPMSTCKKV